MADTVYTAGIDYLITNGWTSSDLRVLLVDDGGSYSVDKDHDRLDDITGDELSTTGYARQAIASESQSIDNTDDEVELDGDDVTFSNLGPATGGPVVQAAVVYFHVDGTDANDVPFLYLDSGGFPKQTNGEDFTIQANVEGWVNVFQQ